MRRAAVTLTTQQRESALVVSKDDMREVECS